MTPLFSVVIPLYNKADTIERAIRSVWGQTFHDYELIIVNDGSTDESLAVVRRLADEQEIVIVNQANAGVSAARNAGVDKARGEYIALLDGDDIWSCDHLQDLARMAKRYPNIGFLGTGYEREAGNYVYFTIPWPWCRVKKVYDAFRYNQPVNSSSVLIRKKEWIDVGGFNPAYGFYEDYEFFFRLGSVTNICISPNASARYKMDAQEQATAKKRQVTRERNPHLIYLETMLETGGLTPSMDRYLSAVFSVARALAILSGNKQSPIDEMFPKLASRVHGRTKVWAHLYLLYYRVRNHLVIWRLSK